MTAYTTDQYNALTAAIATGATEVSYQDASGSRKSVTYRSLADMIALQKVMAQALGLVLPKNVGPYRTVAVSSKGL